jgi:hypothetical protein
MVVTFLPWTDRMDVWHEKTAAWSTSTVHDPHNASPQPYFTPVIPKSVRNTHKSVRSPSTVRLTGWLFKVNLMFSILNHLLAGRAVPFPLNNMLFMLNFKS